MNSAVAPDTTALILALENSSWRELLLGQLTAGIEPFNRKMAMSRAFEAAEKAGKLNSALAPSDVDGTRLIEIGMIGKFPTREPWPPVGSDILVWFWTLRHPGIGDALLGGG